MRGKSAAVGVSNCLPFLFGTIAPRIFLLLSSKQASIDVDIVVND